MHAITINEYIGPELEGEQYIGGLAGSEEREKHCNSIIISNTNKESLLILSLRNDY